MIVTKDRQTSTTQCRVALAMLLFVLACGHATADEYRIGPGDRLSIVVYGEEDLSLNDVRVSVRGNLAFPLLGEVSVQGLTTKDLERQLVKALKQGYLKKPRITVNILEYRPFYINGQVKRPGAYPYVDGLTVRKAIALAGGTTERASMKKISLIRESMSTSQPMKDLEAPLKPGDVITIGESLF